MPSKRDLVLLTNQYPHADGDAAFVESEIGALAREFEMIYIWTVIPSRAPYVVRMPSNVQFMGSLAERHPLRTVLKALTPSLVRSFLSLVWKEARERRRQVQPLRLLRSAAIAVVGGRRLQKGLQGLGGQDREKVMYSFWGTDGALALIAVKERPALCVVRLHGYDLYEERLGYLPFRRELFERADALLTVSTHGAQYLDRKYGGLLELPPTLVARLGTWDLGVGPDAPTSVVRVVSCSSLIGLKRVDLILKTLDYVARDHFVQWTHFGDGPLRAELEALAETTGPRLDVQFQGNVSHEELMTYYQTEPVSVFVNLSTTEGLPVSIMEALSFDIPVLATDVGGTSEIVGETLGSGLLVPAGASVEEIACALELLLGPGDQWQPREVWEELCNARKNGETVAHILSTGSFSSTGLHWT